MQNRATIDEIKDKIDIVALIGETVTLKHSSGDTYKGALTASSKSGESLNVDRSQQVWKDWANDGSKGDVYNWIAFRDGLDIETDFPQILKIAADYAGVELKNGYKSTDNKELLTLNTVIANFYNSQLTAEIRTHITEKWGITDKTINVLKIGFAPVKDSLLDETNGVFDPKLLKSSGLVIDTGFGVKDFFKGRIVFPYWKGSHVVYFIGRKCEHTPQTKYESAKYKKQLVHSEKREYISGDVNNSYFYGENSIKNANNILITEGVTDCIMAIQNGIPCISPVTTRFRKEDYQRMLSLVERVNTVYICNDAEDNESGLKGAIDTAKYLESEGIDVKLVQLPRADGIEKIDVADFLRDTTKEDFEHLMLNESIDVWTLMLSNVVVPSSTTSKLRACQTFIKNELSGINEVVRDNFVNNDVAKRFGYGKRDISKILKSIPTNKCEKNTDDAQHIQHQYTNLARTQENGSIKLLYPEIADMLSAKYDIISYGKEIFVYEDGFYKDGETIIKQEITKIARAVNFEDGIKTPTEEVIHYIAYDDPCEIYPFNVQDNAINVKNGVVVIDFDNETFKLVEHDPKFKFNYKFDIKFNPANTTDIIHKKVICEYVEPGDVDILYQIVAQALLQTLGAAPFKKAYLLQGDQDAGKSGFLELLLRTFGKKTHSQVSLQDLCNNRFALANLEGKLLNTYDDLSEVQLSNTGKFKTVTGKEDHDIERKGKQGYTARLSAVHVYTCNTPPMFDKGIKNDTAFWGRWEYIHFPYHFERDSFFYNRMFTPENLEGFFINILKKVIKIRKDGLQINSTPGEVREKWSFNADPLYQFIKTNMEPSERDITLNKDNFLEAYNRWCVSTDVDTAKIITGKKAFTIALDKYGFIDRQVTTVREGRVKCYQGMFKWQLDSKHRISPVELKTEQGSL